jgi:DNA-binding transcriptional MerR regulator
MLPVKDDPLKRYYSMGEVSEILGVSKSLIRFWESEFDHIKPHKNSKGDRRFTAENVEQLRMVYHLVKERGFTLAGARHEIKEQRDRLRQKIQVLDKMKEIRGFLKELAGNSGEEEE